jgi:hypothetical protein
VPNGGGKQGSTNVGSGYNQKVVERSTIEFPYLDQENAFEISKECTRLEALVATGINWPLTSNRAAQGGRFRLRLITAKAFGLVTYDRGRIALTSLGLRSVDPVQQQAAKVDSFLTVPVQGGVRQVPWRELPPTAGLEREMVTLGVAKSKRTRRAKHFNAQQSSLASSSLVLIDLLRRQLTTKRSQHQGKIISMNLAITTPTEV